MRLVKGLIQKIVGAFIILIVIAALFGGCDSGSSGTGNTTTATKETEKETEVTEIAVVEFEEEATEAIIESETEPTEVETVAATEPLPTFDDPRDEGIEQTAMDTHGISMQTIRKLVAKYRYDDEYTATLSNYECLFYLEDSIEEYNYKITEDGYMAVEWETPEAIEYLRSCISNPDNENTVLTVDEAAALSDDDVIGIYGLMYTWEIYNQDDPGEGYEGDSGNTYEVNYENYRDIARNAIAGDVWSCKRFGISSEIAILDQYLGAFANIQGKRATELISVVNNTSTKIMSGDFMNMTATVGFDASGSMVLYITDFTLLN